MNLYYLFLHARLVRRSNNPWFISNRYIQYCQLSVKRTWRIHGGYVGSLHWQSSVRRDLYLPWHVLKLLGSLLVSREGEKKGEDRPEGWSRGQLARIHGADVRPKSSERSYAQAHVLDLRNTRKTLVIDHAMKRCTLDAVCAPVARIDRKFPFPFFFLHISFRPIPKDTHTHTHTHTHTCTYTVD